MFRSISILLREKLAAYRRLMTGRASRVPARSKARHAGLRLESLEERTLPSVAPLPLPPAPAQPLTAMVAPLHPGTPTANDGALASHHSASAISTHHVALVHPPQPHEHHEPITPIDGPDAGEQPVYFVWSPQGGNTDASNGNNWYQPATKQRGIVPGGPDGVAVFDSTYSNSPINWDNQSYEFAEMEFGKYGGAYTAQQTIWPGISVVMMGSPTQPGLAMDVASSNLNLYFLSGNSVFQLDANATITNMQLAGSDAQGQFVILAGTTTIAPNPGYTDLIGVPFRINSAGTLTDLSYNTLYFNANNLVLNDMGTMNVDYGPGTGASLIAPNQTTGDYINVNGGTLTYYGQPEERDNFQVPVVITNGGWFTITSFTDQGNGANLSVLGATGASQNASVAILNGTGSEVRLGMGASLECGDDYYQAAGILTTTDASSCTLVDGPNGMGTVNIVGGDLDGVYDSNSGKFSTLTVECSTLNFAGTYSPDIWGGGTDSSVLSVKGNLILDPQNSKLLVGDIGGSVTPGQKWSILFSTGITNDFASKSNTYNAMLTYGPPNMPKNGEYQVSS